MERGIICFRVRSKGQHCITHILDNYCPLGYPRFLAPIAADDSFHLCRYFSDLRAHLLLLKLDRLSMLEKKLETIDKEETAILFLGGSRSDSSEKRNSVLSE